MALKDESFWIQVLSHRTAWILLVGVALLLIIFQRKLYELRINTYLFTGTVFFFIILLVGELLFIGAYDSITMTFDDIKGPKVDVHLITVFSILLYSFVQ